MAKISQAQKDKARALLADGMTRKDTARMTGMSQSYLSKLFPDLSELRGDRSEQPPEQMRIPVDEAPPPPKRPDPPPRVHKPKGNPRRPGPTDEQLEAMVRKIAKTPAIPAGLWLHCDYCANHFNESAGPLAAELVARSHEDQDLRDILVWLYTGWAKYAWAGMFIAWLGVPLLHHLAPGPVYQVAAPLMGMPPREQPRHVHRMPPAPPAPVYQEPPSNGEVPTPSPFAGMELADILGTATALGIDLDAMGMSWDQITKLMADYASPPIEGTAAPIEPQVTVQEQERDLAAAAAEAAAAQTAALAADPDAI